jgi:hypothetical protein
MDPSEARVVETALDVHDVSDETYLKVLDACLRVMAESGIRYCFIGGLASSIYGRQRTTHDLDLFVRPEDAERTLGHLAANGFKVEKSDPDWIFKAEREGLLVDVIFRASEGTVLDGDLERRIRVADFGGRRVPIVPPEDLLVTKVAAFREDTPRQWFDCLAVLQNTELDWDYLVARTLRKPHRVLALLLYAAGGGSRVPEDTLRRLFEAVIRVNQEPAA